MNEYFMKQTKPLSPRLIRLHDAPRYLGIDKYAFNQFVRPYLREIHIGKRRVLFDRHDLDRWIDEYKTSGHAIKASKRRHQVNTLPNIGRYGVSNTDATDNDEFTQIVQQLLSK